VYLTPSSPPESTENLRHPSGTTRHPVEETRRTIIDREVERRAKGSAAERRHHCVVAPVRGARSTWLDGEVEARGIERLVVPRDLQVCGEGDLGDWR